MPNKLEAKPQFASWLDYLTQEGYYHRIIQNFSGHY